MENRKLTWTPERVERLVRLWNSGLSASKVADRLGGVSRNAVIGKVYRLKGEGKNQIEPDGGMTVAGSVSISGTAIRRGRNTTPNRAANDPRPTEPEGATFLELDQSSCRWPIGDPTHADFRFCGTQRVSHGSYCASHMEEAYQTDTRRRKTS